MVSSFIGTEFSIESNRRKAILLEMINSKLSYDNFELIISNKIAFLLLDSMENSVPIKDETIFLIF